MDRSIVAGIPEAQFASNGFLGNIGAPLRRADEQWLDLTFGELEDEDDDSETLRSELPLTEG